MSLSIKAHRVLPKGGGRGRPVCQDPHHCPGQVPRKAFCQVRCLSSPCGLVGEDAQWLLIASAIVKLFLFGLLVTLNFGVAGVLYVWKSQWQWRPGGVTGADFLSQRVCYLWASGAQEELGTGVNSEKSWGSCETVMGFWGFFRLSFTYIFINSFVPEPVKHLKINWQRVQCISK